MHCVRVSQSPGPMTVPPGMLGCLPDKVSSVASQLPQTLKSVSPMWRDSRQVNGALAAIVMAKWEPLRLVFKHAATNHIFCVDPLDAEQIPVTITAMSFAGTCSRFKGRQRSKGTCWQPHASIDVFKSVRYVA